MRADEITNANFVKTQRSFAKRARDGLKNPRTLELIATTMSTAAHTLQEPAALAKSGWPAIDRLTGDAALRMPHTINWYTGVKIALDYTLAAFSLPFAAMLVAMAAIAVKLTSRGPVFYTQTRIGLNGRRYQIIKLRTMYHDCEARSGIKWSQKGDNRITPVGKVLRITHIDELPQLWNVLCGEMSLVGPRPERPEVIKAKGLDQLVPGYKHRLLVKPGVTGLAQVQLPADTDISSVRYKVVYDLYYVQHQSLLLDLRLLLATVFKAIGVGPRLLRWLFLLPSQRRVAEVFQNCVEVTAESNSLTALQPA
jgi:lipopolysaccharide/colanic/teichoic acid biosynthesis glycosyltransferase